MSQLTITLSDDLLQAAQAYARQHGQELDALVARLLAEAVQPPDTAPANAPPELALSPRIQRLFGAVQVPAGFDYDYKKVLEEEIQGRFGG